MVEIELKYNFGYKWYENDGIYVKGYLFDKKGNFIEKEGLINYLKDIESLESFYNKINNSSGSFVIVINKNNKLFIASDIVRTFPLFYIMYNGKIYLSDNAFILQKKFSLQFDKNIEKQFLCSGYVIGENTLLKNLKQIEAGQIVEIENNTIFQYTYFNYTTDSVYDIDFLQLQNNLENILEKVTKRLIKSANGRTLCIPLSGGYDSRIIATLLKKYNYKNVICYTYGVKNSFEVNISKKVAKHLNYPWYFVEYTDKLLERYFYEDDFNRYIKFASNFITTAHIQDYFAIKQLIELNIIPKNSIFVPGHSGDLFAGTHISKYLTFSSSTNDAVKEIINKHFSLCPKIPTEIFKYIKDNLSKGFAYSQMEAWSTKERQSKFIVNSTRVYEFFGFEHRMPLWDKELADFFKMVPFEFKNRNFRKSYRIDNNLYYSVLSSIFRNFNVEFRENKLKIIFNKILAKLNIYQQDINNFNKVKSLFAGKENKIKYGKMNYFEALYSLNTLKINK